MLGQVAFGIVAIALLGSASRVVTARNLVHTVLWLGLTLAVTSVVYIMLSAPFLAAIQIILMVVVFNYCVIRELGRVLGEESMLRVFFGARPRHE